MLETADLVLCEDTRHTGTLLSALGIRARTEALHDHNEDARTPAVLARLRQGQTICLVSDVLAHRWFPDPGYRLRARRDR